METKFIIQCSGTDLIDGLYCAETYGTTEGYKKLKDIADYWSSLTGHPMIIRTVTLAEVKGRPYLNDHYGPRANHRRSR